jgi:hypothetical protein
MRCCLLLALLRAGCAIADTAFAEELEKCIRQTVHGLAASFPEWGNSCMAPTAKVDRQANVYEVRAEISLGSLHIMRCATPSI